MHSIYLSTHTPSCCSGNSYNTFYFNTRAATESNLIPGVLLTPYNFLKLNLKWSIARNFSWKQFWDPCNVKYRSLDNTVLELPRESFSRFTTYIKFYVSNVQHPRGTLNETICVVKSKIQRIFLQSKGRLSVYISVSNKNSS